MSSTATTISRTIVLIVLVAALAGSSLAVWGLGAQDRISSDLYDVRDPKLDAQASPAQEQAQWILDILNGRQFDQSTFEERLSPTLKRILEPIDYLSDIRFLTRQRPFDIRGFDEDPTGRQLVMAARSKDGQVLTIQIAGNQRGQIEGLLLTPEDAARGPLSALQAIVHLVAGWGLLLAGGATWLWRHRPLPGKLLLAAGAVWIAQMLELTSIPLTYSIGLVAGPIAVGLVAAALLAFRANGLESLGAKVVLGLVALAVAITIAPLLAIDTTASSLPRQFLSLTHDRDLASTLAAFGQVSVIVGAAALVGLLWQRHRHGRGIGTHQRLVLLIVGTTMAAVVAGLAAWGLTGDHHDLSQSAFVSLAALAVPAGLTLTALQEGRVALGGVATMVADVQGAPSRSRMQWSLAQALGDPSVALAFWSPDRDEYVSSSGQSVIVEADVDRAVTYLGTDEDRVGAVMHDPALLAEPERVQAAAAAAQLAMEAERNQALAAATLRDSRSRIVESAEQARRSVERDLHDGAQQRLIALQLSIKLEQQRVESAGESVSLVFLGALSEELGDAIVELRELGRGLRPSALDHGLRAAIESLAERSSLPLVVDVTDARVPARLESAAYFVVNEAVANATRHSGADHVRVRVTRDPSSLLVNVADDGVGGARKGQGAGLQSLEDRVLALDGLWKLDSPPGLGTSVSVEFPLQDAAAT